MSGGRTAYTNLNISLQPNMIIIIRSVQAGHGDILVRMEMTEADNEGVFVSFVRSE